MGEGDEFVIRIHPQVMEPGKIYNVKQSVWHSVVLSLDGSVLIVENKNTSEKNSNYFALNPSQRSEIVEVSRREQSDWC